MVTTSRSAFPGKELLLLCSWYLISVYFNFVLQMHATVFLILSEGVYMVVERSVASLYPSINNTK
jgi:hypothetical protein